MNFRKVRFNRFIPIQYNSDFPHRRIEGTGCMQTGFPNEGYFHQWGSITECDNGSFCAVTTAIIETKDGSIYQIYPEHIKFIDTIPD